MSDTPKKPKKQVRPGARRCNACSEVRPLVHFTSSFPTICNQCLKKAQASPSEVRSEEAKKAEAELKRTRHKEIKDTRVTDSILIAEKRRREVQDAEQQKQKKEREKKAAKELARRELARRRLLPFVQYFNDQYLPGWVHRDICIRLEKFLQDVLDGKSPRLMLFMPPRSGKSEIASRAFPAWALGHSPKLEFISASYGADLAEDFSKRVREIIQSADYTNIFNKTKIKPNDRAASKWSTTANGTFIAAGVGGPITGRGAHIAVIDDPFKNREDAESPGQRQKVRDWYTSTLYTRLAPGGGVLLIMTRWHDDDLAGWLEKEQLEGADQWEQVRYAAVATQDEKYRKKGEALHPERYPLEALQRIERAVGPRDWSSMYQQNPVPDEGAYFQKSWFKYYALKDRPKLEELSIYQAWDFAIGQREGNDFTVGICIGVDRQGHAYVLDLVRGRWDSFDIVENMLALAKKWKPAYVGAEHGQIEMALGPIINKRMRETKIFFPIKTLKTGSRDKLSRARPLQGRMQQGLLLIPKENAFTLDLTTEMLRFPAGVHDDQVDALAWCFQMLELFSAVAEPRAKKKKSWKDKLDKFVVNGNKKRNYMTA